VVATERSAADLRAAFQASTVLWKMPKKWLLVRELPLTARGKPDTRAMQTMLERSRQE
jgi:acyl-CoA synthetase (AMP-forming)/AMP-acid ligase II